MFPAIDKDQFQVNTKKKHYHEGAPLGGAYCVDLAPVANRRFYNVEIMRKMVTILRHRLSCISDAIVWPDGFVFWEDVVRAEWKNDWREFLVRFCKSYTNEPIDDTGVRMQVLYLAKNKNWTLSPDLKDQWREPLQGFQRVCRTQTDQGLLKVGFYIRAEGGMSESIHRSVLMSRGSRYGSEGCGSHFKNWASARRHL